MKAKIIFLNIIALSLAFFCGSLTSSAGSAIAESASNLNEADKCVNAAKSEATYKYTSAYIGLIEIRFDESDQHFSRSIGFRNPFR